MTRDELLTPIRERAYHLWEHAGRPDGGDLEFWERARQEIEQEQAKAQQPTVRDHGPAPKSPGSARQGPS